MIEDLNVDIVKKKADIVKFRSLKQEKRVMLATEVLNQLTSRKEELVASLLSMKEHQAKESDQSDQFYQ